MAKYDERNPLYRRQEPKPPQSEPSLIENVITGPFVGIIAALIQLAGAALVLSLIYRVIVLIFRHVFGVELPNLFN
jgi:hypothetical protein